MGTAAASAGSLWNKSLKIKKGRNLVLLLLKKKKFQMMGWDGTHMFLFGLFSEGLFSVFVLGTNKVLLKNKKMTRRMKTTKL